MDLGYFLNLLRNIEMGRSGRIVIFNDQGRELARFESGGLAVGDPLPETMILRLASGRSGQGELQDPVSGTFFYSYLHVRDYPFIIMISQGAEDFFSAFEQYRVRVIGSLSILTALCGAGLFYLLTLLDKNSRYLHALAEIPGEEDISPVVEKIIAAVSSPYEDLEGHRIVTSPSIGIAVYPRDGSTIESLLLNADAAMYKSKQSGRCRCRSMYPPGNSWIRPMQTDFSPPWRGTGRLPGILTSKSRRTR